MGENGDAFRAFRALWGRVTGTSPIVPVCPSGAQLADMIRRLLSTCMKHGAVVSFASLLISLPRGRLARLKARRIASADVAGDFFDELGFRVDRTRMNSDGYPGLLRKLMEPAPWIEVEPEDCDGPVSPDRARELRPLFRLATEASIPELLARYKDYVERRNREVNEICSVSVPEVTMLKEVAVFEDIVRLARCIGAKSFEDVVKAVFVVDEFPPYTGAPDLLVWLPDSEDGLWFFAEVKAPRDSLRESQREWLKTNWDVIRGRFLQVILE